MWAKRLVDVANNGVTRPFQHYYMYYLKKAYPHSSPTPDMLRTNLSYTHILDMPFTQISSAARETFRAYGGLPPMDPCSANKDANVTHTGGLKPRTYTPPKQDTPHHHVRATEPPAIVFRALRANENMDIGLTPPGLQRGGMCTPRQAIELGTRQPSYCVHATSDVLTALTYAESRHDGNTNTDLPQHSEP